MLSTTITSPFGILSTPASQNEDCHVCLEKINIKQLYVVKLPCCGHLAHSECFKTWALSSLNTSELRCAYCRTTYPYEDKCFLCLNNLKDKDTKCTSCCQSRVHAECVNELQELRTLLVFEHTLECGQLWACNCLWVHV